MEGAILGYVVKKLGDILLEEISVLSDTRRDLEWMLRELRIMQSYLRDIATEQTSHERIRCWIEDIQQLTFQAEDIVDSLSSKGIGIIARHNFGREVRMFKKGMEDMTRKRTTYGIQQFEMEPSSSLQDDRLLEMRRNMAAYRDQDNNDVVVGLEPHVDAVMERLQGDEMKRLVVSIVGMGGIGKTTLAKKVYRNMRECFDYSAWVVVTKEYNFLQLLQRIGQEVTNISSRDLQRKNREELERELNEFIWQKRYLIILDDVWETRVLDDFYHTFPDPCNRSRMVITTRFLNVGRSVNLGVFPPYELPFLDEDAAWELFAKKVFPYEQNLEKCFTDKLKRHGKEMVAKCNGLPLAIIVLGDFLSSRDKSHYAWSRIADGTQWKESGMDDGCMKILALSYQTLPVHMRWCFLYLGIFPKDTVINVQNLLRLWIAECFIIKIDGEDLEETAERYVEELIQRCLVQVVKRNSYGSLVEIRVHDMPLKLAITEAKRGRFLEVWRNEEDVNLASNTRRLAIEKDFSRHSQFFRNLRSLFLNYNVVPRSLSFKNLNLLRVLDVYRYNLPKEVGLLVNLRYLRVEELDTFTFLSFLGKLKHLQTLEIHPSRFLWESTRHMDSLILPSSLWQIKTLRHIIAIGVSFEVSRKAPIGDNILPNLRTLKGIIAGPWIKNILPRLNNLKELGVQCIDKEWMVESISSAIQNLQQLNILKIHGKCMEMEKIFLSDNTCQHLYELVIHGGRWGRLNRWSCPGLPQNLSKVQLEYVFMDSNILKQLGSLQSLKELTLDSTAFEEQQHMAFEGGSFPQLRVLKLIDLPINRWVLESECLDNLTTLEICNCRNLEALPEGLERICTLECLELWFMGSKFVERNRGLIDEHHCKIDIRD